MRPRGSRSSAARAATVAPPMTLFVRSIVLALQDCASAAARPRRRGVGRRTRKHHATPHSRALTNDRFAVCIQEAAAPHDEVRYAAHLPQVPDEGRDAGLVRSVAPAVRQVDVEEDRLAASLNLQ